VKFKVVYTVFTFEWQLFEEKKSGMPESRKMTGTLPPWPFKRGAPGAEVPFS